MWFADEKSFEQHVASLLRSKLSGTNFVVLDSKKVADVVICSDDTEPVAFFLEFKILTPTKNRLGFGDRIGDGFQPEILAKRPKFFERYLRWVLCRCLLPQDEDRQFVFATNAKISEYIMGGTIGDKHNNIRPSIFKREPLLTESELVNSILSWLHEPHSKPADASS